MSLLALAILSSLAAEPTGTITVDPLTTAIGFVHVQVERSVHPRISLYAGPSLRLFDGILPDVNGPYIGLGAEAGVRGFLTGRAPEGTWLMLRGVLARVSTRDLEPRTAQMGGYTSGLVGYTTVLGRRFVLSGGAGLSWFDYGVLDYGVHGLAPALHTNVGAAF